MVFIDNQYWRSLIVSQSSRLNSNLTRAFAVLLGITLAVWILRGLGLLSFMPGGVLLLLLFCALATGIFSYVQKRWLRF